ncbi:hypothetical protein BD311DRAFT_764594 [Dichomitus squalens]|uniref:Uncharacterized protein n=1 Tax=Dichomitus squalens TaxID=114155 RepID=A0A4Q9MFX6_9APHY|nr:hypothetical protein BD311DRAFT_764594 [Dichomitus squalens]
MEIAEEAKMRDHMQNRKEDHRHARDVPRTASSNGRISMEEIRPAPLEERMEKIMPTPLEEPMEDVVAAPLEVRTEEVVSAPLVYAPAMSHFFRRLIQQSERSSESAWPLPQPYVLPQTPRTNRTAARDIFALESPLSTRGWSPVSTLSDQATMAGGE